MHLILCYPTGRRVDGLLLAASPTRMRLAVRNPNETIELHREEDRWYMDDETLVEIESVIWDGHSDLPAQVRTARG